MERFLSKVNKTDTCWLWTGCCNKKGYGQFRINGKTVKTHRWSYEQHIGLIPPNLLVRHKCDVRNCVNPDHLEVGTHQENMRDMVERGRHGDSLRNFKLTEDDVRFIRVIRVFGFNCYELAKMYSLGGTTMKRVLNGQTWSSVQ